MARKTRTVKIRVSPEHREMFVKAASVERVSLSEWLRRQALLRTAELGVGAAQKREDDQ